MSNASRQAAYKARQRAEGKQQLTVWVRAEQAAHIRAYLAAGAGDEGGPPGAEGAPTIELGEAARVFVYVADCIETALEERLPPRAKAWLEEALDRMERADSSEEGWERWLPGPGEPDA